MHGSHVFFMGTVVFGGLLASFLGLVVLVIVVSVRATSRRRDSLARFAASHGLSYILRLPGGFPPAIDIQGRVYASEAAREFLQLFGDCHLFNSGSWRDVQNVIAGYGDDCEWLIFDYSHWTECQGQQESEVVDVTCVVLRTSHPLGCFSVEPKVALLGTLAAFAKPSGIIKTGDEAFDARFIVRGRDSAAAPFALSGPVRQYLLGLYSGPRRWYRWLYVQDTAVIITETRASVPHIEDMMKIAKEFVRLAEAHTF